MAERRALWVSTSVDTKGGVASYVRTMQRTSLWSEWNVRHVATHRDGSAAMKIATFALGAVRFVVEVVRFRPNVVHLHASGRGSFLRKAMLFWLSRPAGVRVVLHMHDSGFAAFYENAPAPLRRLIRATTSRADAFVALGPIWADRLRAIAPNARIIAIPNAVHASNHAERTTCDGPTRVVFLGRIGDHKGTFALLDAWAKFACDPLFTTTECAPATLTIAGDGEVARARRRVDELDIGVTVDVRDWLSENAVADLLDSADVLVLPSRNEGQPMAVLEAMARGLCVVASDVGGIPDMIGDGCGALIAPDDAEAIAAALRLVVPDRELRARYGRAARERVRVRYDSETVARRMDALYREVCS